MQSVFEVIAEPNRRAILGLLSISQQSVGEIERQLGMPQPAVSKHLKVLRDLGFVDATVDQQRRLYRLNPAPLREVDAWLDQFRRFWMTHLDALERHLDLVHPPTPMTKKTTTQKPKRATKAAKKTKPVLLSGDNPQIPKGEGDAPVRAYIAAIPGWKRPLARRLDEIIVRTVPGVHKAVKWNSPFYGVKGAEGWFVSFHCFTSYIKVTFFRGSSLMPLPPGASKHPEVRYYDVREGQLDEAQFAAWVKQASVLPGEKL